MTASSQKFPVWVTLLLLAVVALAPLPFGSNRPFFEAGLNAAAGAAVLLWGLAALRYGPHTVTLVPWRNVAWRIAPFVLIGLGLSLQCVPLMPPTLLVLETAQALGLPAPHHSPLTLDLFSTTAALTSLIALLGLFLMAVQMGRDTRWAKLFFIVLATASTLYALYGLCVFALGNTHILWFEKWAYQESLTATFVNRNAFAAYAGLGLLTTLCLMVGALQRHGGKLAPRTLILGLSAAAILGTSLLLSSSRMGLVSVLCGLVTFLISSAISRTLPRALLLKVSFVSLVAFAGLGVIAGSGMMARLNNATLIADERPEIWVATLALIKEKPITGWGAGTFEATFAQVRTGKTDFTYNHAHSTYLEKAAEWGLPLTLLGVLGLGLIGARLFQGVRTRRQNAHYPAAALAMGVQAATHATVDFAFQMPANAALLALALGVGFAQSFRSTEKF